MTVLDADLKKRKKSLEDELRRIDTELEERSKARQGEGWLCWNCTEKARAKGRIEPIEHIYHKVHPDVCASSSTTKGSK